MFPFIRTTPVLGEEIRLPSLLHDIPTFYHARTGGPEVRCLVLATSRGLFITRPQEIVWGFTCPMYHISTSEGTDLCYLYVFIFFTSVYFYILFYCLAIPRRRRGFVEVDRCIGQASGQLYRPFFFFFPFDSARQLVGEFLPGGGGARCSFGQFSTAYSVQGRKRRQKEEREI